MKAECEKRTKILEAEGERQAAILRAEGDVKAINYFLGQKYIQTLGDVSKSDGTKLVLMPLDAAGVVGAIGGITEITKLAAGKG